MCGVFLTPSHPVTPFSSVLTPGESSRSPPLRAQSCKAAPTSDVIQAQLSPVVPVTPSSGPIDLLGQLTKLRETPNLLFAEELTDTGVCPGGRDAEGGDCGEGPGSPLSPTCTVHPPRSSQNPACSASSHRHIVINSISSLPLPSGEWGRGVGTEKFHVS